MKKALLATAVACMAPALAVNVNAADIRWNGFASITAGVSTSEAKRADGEEFTLYGYDEDFNFRPESKLALQASSNLGNGLSVTAQAIARGTNDFDVDMEWAFISYDFGDSSRINLGKLRIPFYQYSDFLDVGYAYPWIRPPQSVYDLFFSTMEGASVQFNGELGSWDSSLQVVAGRTSNELLIFGEESQADLNNLWGGAWTIGNDWLTMRAAYFQAEVTFSNDNLDLLNDWANNTRPDPTAPVSVTNPVLGSFPAAAEAFSANGDIGSFVGLGFKVDKNDWLMGAEITQIKVEDSFVVDQDSAYISLGRRFNDLTFMVTYEINDNDTNGGIANSIPTSTGNPSLDVLYGTLAASLNGVEALGEGENNTITVGMRYNFHPSASFKVEYSQREYDTSAFQTVDDNAGVVAFSIDAIF